MFRIKSKQINQTHKLKWTNGRLDQGCKIHFKRRLFWSSYLIFLFSRHSFFQFIILALFDPIFLPLSHRMTINYVNKNNQTKLKLKCSR